METLPIIKRIWPAETASNLMPIGRIEYLSTKGKVTESAEYTKQEHFINDIMENNDCGVPMRVVLYRGKDGKTVSRDFVMDLNCSNISISIIEFPYSDAVLLDAAKLMINDFVREEYQDNEGADFSNLAAIPVAYTNTEDEQHEIQAYVDIPGLQIRTCLDKKTVSVEQYPNLWAMCRFGLQYLTFDELTEIPDQALQAAS